MQKPVWSTRYETGIAGLDQQHRGLFLLVEGLWHLHGQGVANGGSLRFPLGQLLLQLQGYVHSHFAFEELLLSTHGYPGREEHVVQHRVLKRRVEVFQQRLQGAGGEEELRVLLEDLGSFLVEWLDGHILVEAQKMVPFLRERGVE